MERKARLLVVATVTVLLLLGIQAMLRKMYAPPLRQSIVIDHFNDIVRGRANHKVAVEKEGSGALVLPGRLVIVHLPNYVGSGIININTFPYRVGSDEPTPIKEFGGALLGRKEGSVVLVRNRFGSYTAVEIVKVCRSTSLREAVDCPSADPDQGSFPELLECSSFADPRCLDQAKRAFLQGLKQGLDDPIYLVEYCLLKNSSSCEQLAQALAKSVDGAQDGREVGRTLDAVNFLGGFYQARGGGTTGIALFSTSDILYEDAIRKMTGPITPESAKALLEAIDKNAPASPRIIHVVLKGLLSTIPNEQREFVSAIGGAGRPLPERMEKALDLRKMAEARRRNIEHRLSEKRPSDLERAFYYGSVVGEKNLEVEDLTRVNEDGYNPLMLAAIGRGERILTYNIKDHLLLNRQNQRGESVLHFMAENGTEPWRIDRFLKAHPGVIGNLKDRDGKTPADWARERGYEEAAKLIETAAQEKK